MLDEYFGSVALRTYLGLTIIDDVSGVDYIALSMPPVEEFHVVIIFFLVGPHHLVLIDLLIRLYILQDLIEAVFFRIFGL